MLFSYSTFTAALDTSTVTAIAVTSTLLFYLSLKPILEFITKLQLNPLDDKIGHIETLSYKQLQGKCTGKKALLVGGTRGVGYGTALALAQAGAHVTVVGRSEKSGAKATASIQAQTKGDQVAFLQGDIGTVASTKALVNRIIKSGQTYNYLIVSAAIFPQVNDPEPLNDDGVEKAFAIAVVGRFLLYHQAHRFLNKHARILNVMAAGNKLPGRFCKENVRESRLTSLFEGVIDMSLGNSIMLAKLSEHSNDKPFQIVSTHPGILKSDLHRGQGILFDLLESFICHFMGINEEECGRRQASILLNDKLQEAPSLSLVDQFSTGRLFNEAENMDIKEHGEWLWKELIDLEDSIMKEKNH